MATTATSQNPSTPTETATWHQWLPYIVWAQALVATVVSLGFSEIGGLIPCMMCWYERIAMYPLVVIMTVAILRRDKGWVYTVLPLSIIGFAISFYHSLLQWKIIPEAIIPCQAGLSCADVQLNLFGFITIPAMAMTAFVIITVATGLYLKGVRRES